MIDPDTLIDGRYLVISRLGSGGMADVYLAQDQLLGRQVAVKVLHHHFAEDHEFVERFRREASSAAALSHPNIVAIFDRGEWNGTYYIAMEYVPGRSLKALVRETGPLDPVVAIDTVIQILRAARFAHKRGVIHRDLKPHNVILDEDGRARVTDFGIARAGASDMTLTGSIMGTAQYLSPEQAQGHTVSASSDLYSVGVILYELLTGVVPFEGESAVAIAFKQVSAAPRPPSELNPALSPSLDAVVLRALAKDPSERYADDDELIAALEAEREKLGGNGLPTVLAAETLQAYEPPTGLLLVAPLPDDEPETTTTDEESKRRKRKIMWWSIAGVAVVAAIVAAILLLGSSSTEVTVPSVEGQTEQAAGAILRTAGLKMIPSLAASSTVRSGLVFSQNPPAGSTVAKGTTVTVVVSGGAESVALEDVKGLTAAEAEARLKKAGFKPTPRPQSSATVAEGRVIETNPAAGTDVKLGSPVTVFVSSGPEPVRVPDVKGQSLTAAEGELTSAGLRVGTVTKRATTSVPPETVLTQTPAAAKSVKPGSTVDLVVAEAPKEVSVPSVVGETQAAAGAALKGAGFKVKTVSQTTTEASQVGLVLRQSPAGGNEAVKGSTVTIAVGALSPTTTSSTTTPTTPATATPSG